MAAPKLYMQIYSPNDHFCLGYEMIYQFLGMRAKNYKFGMFCQRFNPSVSPGDANIWLRNHTRGHTCHLFTSHFCLDISTLEDCEDKYVKQNFQNIVLDSHANFWEKLS